MRDIEAKAKREIRSRGWLSPHDSIAIAFSGGPGSTACLLLLHKLFASRRDITLHAIYIDEGIHHFRDPNVFSIAEQIGVRCITKTFQEVYGMTVDQYAAHCEDVCLWCNKKRQLLIDQIAQEHNITKIAYGYHLEDVSRAVVAGIVKGDPSFLLYGDTRIDAKHIAPLCMIPEREVLLYAGIEALTQCPYAEQGGKGEIAEVLDKYADKHPSVHHAIVSLSRRISSKDIQKE